MWRSGVLTLSCTHTLSYTRDLRVLLHQYVNIVELMEHNFQNWNIIFIAELQSLRQKLCLTHIPYLSWRARALLRQKLCLTHTRSLESVTLWPLATVTLQVHTHVTTNISSTNYQLKYLKYWAHSRWSRRVVSWTPRARSGVRDLWRSWHSAWVLLSEGGNKFFWNKLKLINHAGFKLRCGKRSTVVKTQGEYVFP